MHIAVSKRPTRVQVRHFSHLLGMVYEANTISASHGWIRKYPMEAHDLLPQLYYRGSEEHAPAYCRYYPAGRGTELVAARDCMWCDISCAPVECNLTRIDCRLQ